MLGRVARVGQSPVVGYAVVGSIAGLLMLLVVLMLRGQRDTVVLQVEPIHDSSVVMVYIGGEVATPGLYELPRGSRVLDAVNHAGGLLGSADTSAIGLASPLRDADQVIIPSRNIQPAASGPASTPVPSAQMLPVDSTTPAPTQTQVAVGPVNINTAGVSELDRLPGIGPVIASRVIEYRTANGPFQQLEELEAVSGISTRMVDELRPLITLGH